MASKRDGNVIRLRHSNEEMSNDADSGAIYSKGKSICEYFDDAKLPDVLAKYEKVAKVALVNNVVNREL